MSRCTPLVSLITWASFTTLALISLAAARQRSFIINRDQNGTFEKDGKPFTLLSGSIHYPRVHPGYWLDRLQKMRSAGLNTATFYVPWNFHEDAEGQYDFTGWRNITEFLLALNSTGMIGVSRIGPYICAEWDNGGLPWWLVNKAGMASRQTNGPFQKAVRAWWNQLLPKYIKPMLYSHGGPIAMIQIENEYGFYGKCDHSYMQWLKDEAVGHLGNDVVYFTIDRADNYHLECGKIPDGTFKAVDFGFTTDRGKVKTSFDRQMQHNNNNGPLLTMEFYPGVYDDWTCGHRKRSADKVVEGMKAILDLGAGLNFYMFHGGTNFAYWNGVPRKVPHRPVTTSYDYDAPISEAGDITPKFEGVRKAIKTYTGVQPAPVPENSSKKTYGEVEMKKIGDIFSLLDILSPNSKRVNSKFPKTFEEIMFPYGYVLYETTVNSKVKEVKVPGICDRGYVMQDQQVRGIVQKDRITNVQLDELTFTSKLQILVENQGRMHHGDIKETSKGIIGDVILDGKAQTNWTMYPIDLSIIVEANHKVCGNRSKGQTIENISDNMLTSPTVYRGHFQASEISDTFFDPTGWGKGQLFINGNNVGRYWVLPEGPQISLYVPKFFLKDQNEVIVFELEQPGRCRNSISCSISFSSERKFISGPCR